jgi:CRISPR-associated exonuclease Cas4
MSDMVLIDVTDIKQYVCCPRLVYYRYCLPHIKPLTYSMEVGIQAHHQEEEREARRGLRIYGIEQAERLFHYPVTSEALQIKGRIDLVLIVPSLEASEKEVVVVVRRVQPNASRSSPSPEEKSCSPTKIAH